MLRSQQIALVDAASGLLAVGLDPQGQKVYHCTPQTEVMVNDQPAKLADLERGMVVVVTAAKPGEATRVAAMKAKAPEPGTKKILFTGTMRVSAADTGHRPLRVCEVFAGQVVRIVPTVPVHWTSGGKRAGVFCDWNGYPDERIFGLPRMALVAFVGKTPFLPSGDRFSFTVPADGVLGLFANDDDPAGNEGTAEVTVTLAWY